MYLEHYYELKGHFYLQDKEYPKTTNIKIKTIQTCICEINNQKEIKKFNLTDFLLLHFWLSKIHLIEKSYVAICQKQNKIFNFLANFILI